MTPQLSPRTQRLVMAIFSPADVVEASLWLEQECGNNLPFQKDADEFRMERIRFAAIKLSQGKMPELLRAIQLAQQDWRDVLMAAEFGHHLDAHEKWAAEILGEAPNPAHV